MKVYLNDAATGEMVYDLYVTACADTEITATLSGGSTGDYKVIVWKTGVGNSIGDIDFSYLISISGISPATGSDMGGTIITITGENFC